MQPRPEPQPALGLKAGFLIAAIFVILLLVVLILSRQPSPAPPPTPTPQSTNTPRKTRTPFPTLTPRALPSPTAAPVNAVVTDTLRVREQASTTARILGRLKKDDSVLLLSRSDDNQWFSIQYPPDSGQVGWIFGEVVVPQGDVTTLPIGSISPKPPEGATFATVDTEGDPLRVRAGPGTNYEVLARVPDRTRILLVAKSPDGSWYQTIYPPEGGQRGWIAAQANGRNLVILEGSAEAMQVAVPPPTPTPGPTPVPRPTRAANVATGGTILVESDRNGASNILALGENGVVRRALTNSGGAYGARYSPDGERIVYYRTVSTSPAVVNHVWAVDFDGKNALDLSARAGGGSSDSDPDWSPDGKRIVFVRTPRAGAPEIWTMNADGSGAKRVVALSAATGVVSDYSPQPRWSPDGGRIAYAAVARTKSPGAPLYPNIFVNNLNGTAEVQLTDNDLLNTAPVWSPDGSQIAWAAKDFINRENWRVWVMNASGGDPRVLFSSPNGDTGSGAQPAAWRGNRLLIAGWSGDWNAYLGSAGGGALTRITNETSDDIPTDWLP